MSINWKQVLEIETYLNDIFEKNATIERFLWRHPQTINSGHRVDKNKTYSFEDVFEYLTTKYPKDEMIKNSVDGIKELFNACSSGQKICEIDPELLEINEFQEKYRLNKEILKNNILNRCAAFTGSTAFYLKILESIITSEKKKGTLQELSNSAREYLTSSFNSYKIQTSEFESSYHLLRERISEFMEDSRFRAFNNSCEKNNYTPPYSSTDVKTFQRDVLRFSKSEVEKIINTSSTKLFAYEIRDNESPYPEDLRKTDLGDINIYTTLKGLFNIDTIKELKNNNQLLSYIQKVLSEEFKVLPKESINDDYNPNYTLSGNRLDSSLILGKKLNLEKLYNKFIDDYHTKVMNGYIWVNDDVHGITYDYLEFHEENDYTGEFQYSMPFTNVISSYHIAYLKKQRIEKDFEYLKNLGYLKSKN